MNKSEQFSVLSDIGITWYVPTDFCSDDFSAAFEPIEEALSQPKSASAILNELAEPKPVIEAVEQRVEVGETKAKTKPDLTDTKPALEVIEPVIPTISVEPFNWFIAEIGFIHFICDIKQPTLSPVWESAALELLGDIALATGASGSASNRYFSWPPAAAYAGMSDADLPEFLTEYLASDQPKPMYILLGQDAALHVQEQTCKQHTRVEGPTLGELFKGIDHKKALWQTLKPLARKA